MTTCRSNRFSCFFFFVFSIRGVSTGSIRSYRRGRQRHRGLLQRSQCRGHCTWCMRDGCRSGTSVEFQTAKWTDIGQSRAKWTDDRNVATHCAEISWFAARADIKLNSPAMTAAQMILARRRALAPGSVG